jgi:hypothetical protein
LERIGSFFGKLVIGLSFIVHQNPKANAVQQQFDRLLVDQPASSITPKSRYCGSWLRYENPHAAKAALRFSRLARNHNSFDLIQRNLRFGPLVTMYQKKLISTNFENIAWETSSKLSSGLPEWGLNGVT